MFHFIIDGLFNAALNYKLSSKISKDFAFLLSGKCSTKIVSLKNQILYILHMLKNVKQF